MSGILILAEHRDGDLRPVTHELIAVAQSGAQGNRRSRDGGGGRIDRPTDSCRR